METSPPVFVVVVLGFNRPTALTRLLTSLARVEPVNCRADLVVSIDGGGVADCSKCAEGLNWLHGKSEVIIHDTNMGLKIHVETATDRVRDYDAVIVLEDDLSVSPWMLHYCLEAFRAYGKSEEVAQVGLYSHRLNEFSGLPFQPIDYGYDSWFARVPSSSGQMYTRKHWQLYREWKEQNPSPPRTHSIPPSVYDWKHTWKRGFFEYISLKELWVAYPYISLTTNHGDAGTNHAREMQDLQVVLESARRNYSFVSPIDTNAKYDEWFEPLPETFNLDLPSDSEFTVDLAGLKPISHLKSGYLLSRKTCTAPLAEFSCELIPLELNVRFGRNQNCDGCIALGKVEDFYEVEPSPELASTQIARGIVSYLLSKGLAQGHREIRSELRYRLGSAILVPIRNLLRIFGLSRDKKATGSLD